MCRCMDLLDLCKCRHWLAYVHDQTHVRCRMSSLWSPKALVEVWQALLTTIRSNWISYVRRDVSNRLSQVDALGIQGGHIMLAGIIFQLGKLLCFQIPRWGTLLLLASSIHFSFCRPHGRVLHPVCDQPPLPQATEADGGGGRGSCGGHASWRAKHAPAAADTWSMPEHGVLRGSVRICAPATFPIASAKWDAFVRSIYRTVELIDGFHGPIIQTQVYFSE